MQPVILDKNDWAVVEAVRGAHALRGFGDHGISLDFVHEIYKQLDAGNFNDPIPQLYYDCIGFYFHTYQNWILDEQIKTDNANQLCYLREFYGEPVPFDEVWMKSKAEFEASRDLKDPVIAPKIKTSKTNTEDGFVYVCEFNGLYKIGKAKDLKKRLKQIAKAIVPFDFKEVLSIPCSNPLRLEKQIHLQFADKRVEGEWFKLTPNDLEEIKTFELHQ